MKFEDTITAPATVPGTGALSVVRISGGEALTVVDRMVEFANGNAALSKGGRCKFGTVHKDGGILDEVIVNIYKAPHSYTGEDSAELMCHASPYIVSSILEMALSFGCRMASPGEFTQRAFINGKMDLSQAEAVADVISSSDAASHKLAFTQLKGGISAEIGVLRDRLLEMTSLLELELDFSEEDVEFADRDKLMTLLDGAVEKVSRLVDSFRLGNAIKNGIPVAITGPANAGKSTLLNRIVGENRAIVSDIAGTTRDTIEECVNVDGITFRFIDTAGIREAEGEIEKIGIERSFESVKKAETVIVVIDEESTSVPEIIDRIDFRSQQVIFALNKADLEGKNGLNIFVNSCNNIVSLLKNKGISDDGVKFVKISAKNGEGVEELLKTLSTCEKKKLDSCASDSSVLVSNLRHYEVLSTALEQLRTVRTSLHSGLSAELVSEDLRAVLATLSSITGAITTDEVLGEIFGRFCIGK